MTWSGKKLENMFSCNKANVKTINADLNIFSMIMK